MRIKNIGNDLIKTIGANFQITGEMIHAEPYGNGHINDSYAVTFAEKGNTCRYLFQRINRYVFKDPAGLMENISRICQHIHNKALKSNHIQYRLQALSLIHAKDHRPYFQDDSGQFWRIFNFIEGASGYDTIQGDGQAFKVAKAFGEFQKQLLDLPGKPLNPTIPDFHNTPKRYKDFESALIEDAHNRAIIARQEIDYTYRNRDLAHGLDVLFKGGEIPERIVHNDAKLNNVLIDNHTHQVVCVIDLDTVMPGLSLYDFGCMVRSIVSPTAEDEKDLSKVKMRMPVFRRLVEGFLSSTMDFLNDTEIDNLPMAGKVITFEDGIRFLTDYLQGDIYYKKRYDRHNLDRCRTHFRLIESMEEQEGKMFDVVERIKMQ